MFLLEWCLSHLGKRTLRNSYGRCQYLVIYNHLLFRQLECGKGKKEQLLDVIGSHRELMVIGHVNVIKFLPFVHHHNLHLLEQFYHEPGNYSGRPAPYAMATAKVGATHAHVEYKQCL